LGDGRRRRMDQRTPVVRFATTRFRCTRIRYTEAVCGSPGSVEIEPCMPLRVGGDYNLAFLSCATCAPSWEINHVPIDEPPWSVVKPRRQRPLQVPWLRESRGLAYPRASLADELTKSIDDRHRRGLARKMANRRWSRWPSLSTVADLDHIAAPGIARRHESESILVVSPGRSPWPAS
jgi:hypothetical protein